MPTKKRRLNDSTSVIRKPFVSPLRASKPESEPEPSQQNDNAADILYQPSVHAHTIRTIPPDTDTTTTPKQPSSSSLNPASRRKQPAFSDSSRRFDPEEVAAHKALTSLELQIRAVRNEIDALKQAAQLRASTSDAELEDLALKWKLAAQTAAEELFGTVKERVCRMGGAQAWRESEKKKYERQNGLGEFKEEPAESDDADCEFDSEGEELPQDEQEYRKAEKRRVKKEIEEAADVEEEVVVKQESGPKQVWQEAGNDDDVRVGPQCASLLLDLISQQTFTVDMMLRSLGINLNVIGYDKVTQKWVT